MRFYDRENETAALMRICNLSFTRNSRITPAHFFFRNSILFGYNRSSWMVWEARLGDRTFAL